jgi:hypothetical protein
MIMSFTGAGCIKKGKYLGVSHIRKLGSIWNKSVQDYRQNSGEMIIVDHEVNLSETDSS